MKSSRLSALSVLSLMFAVLLAACSPEQRDSTQTHAVPEVSPVAVPALADNAESSVEPADDLPEDSETPSFFQNGEMPSASLVPGTKPDIVGFRLGDRFDKEKLGQLSYSWCSQGEEDTRGCVIAHSPYEKITVSWNDVGMIHYVSREVTYEEDKRPLREVLKKALLEKYGQTPSDTGDVNISFWGFSWDYDNAGNLHRDGSICHHTEGLGTEKCGYWVLATISADDIGNDVMVVKSFHVQAGYSKPLYDEQKYHMDAEIRAVQRKAEETRQKALRNQDVPTL